MHSHRVDTLNAPAQAQVHDQIKRYFARRKELERQRQRERTFSSQRAQIIAEGVCFLLILCIMNKIYRNYGCR